MNELTWEQLTAVEPRLLDLHNEAKVVDGSDEHFCANRVWYDRFKPRLLRLVGWECDNPKINTERAWDVAYETIYGVLPPCRECSCL